MRINSCLMVTALIGGLASPLRAAENDDKQTNDDIAAFKTYLEKNQPGKKWGIGPTRIDSEAIQKVYPDKRFYYVFTVKPLPPGANLATLIKKYKESLKEYEDSYISLTVSIDGKGTVATVDFRTGLAPAKTEAEVKLVAAAIIGLNSSGAPPTPVSVDDLLVTKDDKGWTCTVKNEKAQFTAQVTFDADGKLLNFSKNDDRPLPKSAPPGRGDK